MRVRLTRIEGVDLNLFEFDMDLTFMVFFLNANEHVYGRYGGRDEQSPDERQSLAGLRYSMLAALETHRAQSAKTRTADDPLYITDYRRARARGVNCFHCHQVKEIVYEEVRQNGNWTRELLWRYPPPDNLGLELEIDRGNAVKHIVPDSAVAATGLQAGDVIQQINGLPVHSFGDAQYALDKSPVQGSIEIDWRRGDTELQGEMQLPLGWRRTDITWRASVQDMLPSARLYGRDLTAEERKTHGLTATQLAYWQNYPVHKQAQAAGVEEGDIVLGFDGKQLDMKAYDFLSYVRRSYVVGDRVAINLLRDGNRLDLPMTLNPF